MRIGIDARLAVAPRTGIGSYTANLIRAFARLDAEDEFVLFTDEPLPALPGPNFTNVVIPMKSRLFWTFGALPAACRARGLDLFHGTTNFEVPAFAGCPLVATIHDLIPLRCRDAVSLKFHLLFRGLLGRTVRAAARIITDAEFTRREILARFPARPEKIVTIPLAADPVFSPDPEPEDHRRISDRYGLGGRYLLFVGVVEPRKNVPLLVEAFEIFRRGAAQGRDFQLAIAGGPGYRGREIAEGIRRRDLEPAVRLLGYVPGEDLPRLYRGATLVVVPSRYEGFGLPALEAMASGAPVLAADTSTLPEIVGDAGELFAPDDTVSLSGRITEITGSPVRLALLRERGLRRAAEFSWEKTARRTLEVYREAVT